MDFVGNSHELGLEHVREALIHADDEATMHPDPSPARAFSFSSLCLFMIAAVGGCGSSPTGCDPCFTEAIVHGSLAGQHGTSVSGRNLAIRAYVGSCEGPQRGQGDLLTDTRGQFRGRLSSLYSPFTTGCISVTVRDENGADVVLEYPLSVEFRLESDRTALDSVRIDIEL